MQLLKKPWLNKNDAMASMIGIPSDYVLPDDPDCLPVIQVRTARRAAPHVRARVLSAVRHDRCRLPLRGGVAGMYALRSCGGMSPCGRVPRRPQRYAADQDAFFRDWAAAYTKLTCLGVAGWA